MTLSQIQALDQDALNRQVAEQVMGWERSSYGEGRVWIDRAPGARNRYPAVLDGADGEYIWHPSSSRDQAHEVMFVVTGKSPIHAFLMHLWRIVKGPMDQEDFNSWIGTWAILNASPLEICQAALLCIQTPQEKD